MSEKKLLLFIHGLGGNPQGTWRGFPELIQSDTELNGQFDLEYFHYPSQMLQIPLLQKSAKIQTLARALRTQIDNAHGQYEDIVLVCHSLGGLIARKYLLDEKLRERGNAVQKLLLFAVPNNGADLAGVAKYVNWWNGHIRQLCKNSDLIEELNQSWFYQKLNESIDVKYVVAAQDRIVDEKSATAYWGNIEVDVLPDKGHLNCVKPSQSTDMAFLILKNFVLSSPTSTSNHTLDYQNLSWKSLQPKLLEAFSTTGDTQTDQKRIFGGNLFLGHEDGWIGKLNEGSYQITNSQEQGGIKYSYVDQTSVNNRADESNAIVSAEIQIVSAPTGDFSSGAGLIFRFDPVHRTYYAFVLHKNSSYTFYKRDIQGFKELFSGQYNSERNDPTELLGIASQNENMYLYINNAWIRTIRDSDLKGSGVGILAVGIGEYAIDNFAIY